MKTKAQMLTELENSRHELTRIRQDSVQATRQGDFMKVAQFTAQAANLNRRIVDLETSLYEVD
jgi:hypothetical protein